MNSPSLLVQSASAPAGSASAPMIRDPTPLYERSTCVVVAVLAASSASFVVPLQPASNSVATAAQTTGGSVPADHRTELTVARDRRARRRDAEGSPSRPCPRAHQPR